MKQQVVRLARRALNTAGIDLVRHSRQPLDFDTQTIATIATVQPYTMTSLEKIYTTINATRYVCEAGIPGTIVECGVWRGGSMLAIARTLKEIGDETRALYLFDTFEGMVEPSQYDFTRSGEPASKEFAKFAQNARGGVGSDWCYASLDDVQATMRLSSYPPHLVHFVQGKVEATIPGSAPESIALLRLDTDWYESTRHELDHLVCRVSPYGVVIVDDYGFWAGARKAVDEFIAQAPVPIFLHRIDSSGRAFVVPPELSAGKLAGSD